MNGNGKRFLVFFAVVVYSICRQGCYGQSEQLEAKLAEAKLPTGLRETTTVYDGNDYIYIFGG
jgi:hypothetical protein